MSCGFLIAYQEALARRLSVPVLTSSLLLLPTLAAMMPSHRRVGVLTFSGTALLVQHLAAAGAAADTPIQGLTAGCHFQRAVYEEWTGDPITDFAARDADVATATQALMARRPDLGAILLECTNFPPHSAAIRSTITQTTRLPVYDIWSLLRLVTRTEFS
jgi:hypothetical protein